jgi:hypothetical protein
MGIAKLRDSLQKGADYIDPVARCSANHDMKLPRLLLAPRVSADASKTGGTPSRHRDLLGAKFA